MFSEALYDIVAVAGLLLYSPGCQSAEIYERDNASDDGDSGPAQTAGFSSRALRCLAMSARPPLGHLSQSRIRPTAAAAPKTMARNTRHTDRRNIY